MYVYVYTPCKWCALIRSNSYPSHPCSRGKPGTCIAVPPEHQNGHCMPVHVHKTRQEPTLNSRSCMLISYVPGLSRYIRTSFWYLHTASNQKLEPEKAWERGYILMSLHVQEHMVCVITIAFRN